VSFAFFFGHASFSIVDRRRCCIASRLVDKSTVRICGVAHFLPIYWMNLVARSCLVFGLLVTVA